MGIGYSLFWGFIMFYGTLLLVGNLFKDRTKLWFILAGIIGIATFILALLDLKTPLLIVSFGVIFADLLLVLVKWIGGSLK